MTGVRRNLEETEMKTGKAMKMTWAGLASCLALSVLADEPSIRDVTVRQRWPWSRLVDVSYVLDCDPTQRVNVSFSVYNGAEKLSCPLDALSGDLYTVSNGARRIVWDPTKTGYTNAILPHVRAELTPTTPPLYMIVDLTKEAGATNQIEYVYEADLVAGQWGPWERNAVTNNGTPVESVIWTGVTNDALYKTKTEKLVLRRIPAGTFAMGTAVPPTLSTTLTKDFYAGVFEVTQKQWALVMGNSYPSFYSTTREARPVERVSYLDIRGSTNNVPPVNWPSTGARVSSTNFLGRLRSLTGIGDFDLPTEAQWEYACRAGTTTYYNDGKGTPGVLTSNAQINVLGRYKWNGGYYWTGTGWLSGYATIGPENGTAIVGSYLPNAWGLYDTHGNVWEWCLDWFIDNALPGGIDPVGYSAVMANRVRRGGSLEHDATYCPSSSRFAGTPHEPYWFIGFRVVRTLP